MAEEKRYYWLKIETDFFHQKEIKKLRKIAGGDTYTVIYLKLALLSLKDKGLLYFEGIEKNIADELALELDEEPVNVDVVLNFLKTHNMLEVIDDKELYLNRIPEMTGSETDAAKRMRRMRKGENQIECNNVTEICNDVQECSEVFDNKSKSNNENKKQEKENKKENTDLFFQSVLELYPNKKGISAISKKTKAELEKIGYEKIKLCVERYIEDVEQQRKNGFKTLSYAHGSTFFNTRYKDFLDGNYVAETKPKKTLEEILGGD